MYFGSWNAARSGWCGGAGDPALGGWVMADLEDGLWACNASAAVNPRVQPATSDFVVGMVKGGGGDFWAIKSGDGGAGGGALEELWAGPRPRGYFPMRKQVSGAGVWAQRCPILAGLWARGGRSCNPPPGPTTAHARLLSLSPPPLPSPLPRAVSSLELVEITATLPSVCGLRAS